MEGEKKITSKTIVCPNCHRKIEVKNPHGALFVKFVCSNPQCGLPLRATFGETVVKENPHRTDLPGFLRWEKKIFPLAIGRNLIGRASDKGGVQISIPTKDKTISRSHCQIEVVDVGNHQYKVIISDVRKEDRISALPILLNGEPLQPEDRIDLDSEDIIQLRSVELQFFQAEIPSLSEITLPMG